MQASSLIAVLAFVTIAMTGMVSAAPVDVIVDTVDEPHAKKTGLEVVTDLAGGFAAGYFVGPELSKFVRMNVPSSADHPNANYYGAQAIDVGSKAATGYGGYKLTEKARRAIQKRKADVVE